MTVVLLAVHRARIRSTDDDDLRHGPILAAEHQLACFGESFGFIGGAYRDGDARERGARETHGEFRRLADKSGVAGHRTDLDPRNA